MELVIVVGPEGGIDPVEKEVLNAAGYIDVSLGKRIMRTETAPLFILSAIVYEHELLDNKGGE
jgi:16S rRNA (uracil1498-N3)-methyltransferase